MAGKKGLAEVKALDKSKQSAKSKYSDTQEWEAWEKVGNREDWQYVATSSLEECFELLHNSIHCQIEQYYEIDIEELEEKYGHLPNGVLEQLRKKSKPYLDAFKTQCLEKGECQGDDWLIVLSPSRFKRQMDKNYPFAYSQNWEVGELINTDKNGQEHWDYLADGTLEECLEALALNLSMEVHKEAEQFVHDGDDFSFEDHFEQMAKMRERKFKTIKGECLSKGEYMGDGWQIRSQRNRKECEWLKKNGYPYCCS
jgi:hypothetical protein